MIGMSSNRDSDTNRPKEPKKNDIMQKLMEKEKKMQKNLKKQMDQQMALIKDRAEKNKEKRDKALMFVHMKNKELDQQGVEAYLSDKKNIETRLKTFEEEEAQNER